VIDSTARDETTGVLALAESVRAARVLAGALDEARRVLPDHRPLVVGGDCSILLGILPSLRRHVGRVGLLVVDGHPDFLDGRTSATGETADMELALITGAVGLAGASADSPLGVLGGGRPLVPPEDVVLLGHRTEGLDTESAAELARLPSALRRLGAPDVRRDPSTAGRRAVDHLSRTGAGFWLHLDLDVLDPTALPAVTYPQPGGPDWGQLARLLAPAARLARLLGVSVADYRPDLDPGGRGARRILELLELLLRGEGAR
jgi:arginase